MNSDVGVEGDPLTDVGSLLNKIVREKRPMNVEEDRAARKPGPRFKMPSTNVDTSPITERPPEAFRTLPKSLIVAFACLALALVAMVIAIAILKGPGA